MPQTIEQLREKRQKAAEMFRNADASKKGKDRESHVASLDAMCANYVKEGRSGAVLNKIVKGYLKAALLPANEEALQALDEFTLEQAVAYEAFEDVIVRKIRDMAAKADLAEGHVSTSDSRSKMEDWKVRMQAACEAQDKELIAKLGKELNTI